MPSGALYILAFFKLAIDFSGKGSLTQVKVQSRQSIVYEWQFESGFLKFLRSFSPLALSKLAGDGLRPPIASWVKEIARYSGIG